MEQDATWWTESPGGVEFGGSGFAATLRDYGRFGQFVLQGGVAGGSTGRPGGWFPNAGQPKRVGDRTCSCTGICGGASPTEHSEAFGIFGQSIYVNPKEKIVIVVWSAQQKPTGSAVVSDVDFFAASFKRFDDRRLATPCDTPFKRGVRPNGRR